MRKRWEEVVNVTQAMGLSEWCKGRRWYKGSGFPERGKGCYRGRERDKGCTDSVEKKNGMKIISHLNYTKYSIPNNSYKRRIWLIIKLILLIKI